RSVLRVGDRVDLLQHEERVGRGDVPHQLRAIAHEERDGLQELVAPAPRDVAVHDRLAARRIEQTGQHLERRRLPRPVRPEETDDLAGRDVEGDAADGRYFLELAPEQRCDGRAETGLSFVDAVDLPQVTHTHHGVV